MSETSIMAHGSRLTAHGSRLTAHGQTITLSHCNLSQFLRHIALALAVLLLISQASWAAENYIDENGTTQTCETFTVITSDTTSWTEGWYFASGLSINSRITVSGNVHLILRDNFTLNAYGGIHVADGNSLTIYGQTEGTGTLMINGVENNCAGIGGGNGQAGGNITINGGTVTAEGGDNGAGIGGGNGGAGGTVTINGGTVTATGSGYGAGIGGGNGGAGGTVTINGGTVTATSSYSGAGIGGGYDGAGGTITINGGSVSATGGEEKGEHGAGAGIGGGGYGIANGTITEGGTITLGWTNATDSITATSYSGTVTVATGKTFITDDETPAEISGTVSNLTTINGKKLTPKKYTVSISGTDITADKAQAVAGETVTLTYSGTVGDGYEVVFKVNGTAIDGSSFTMPAEDVTVTAELQPITYTITYSLEDGTAAGNPSTYTIESEAITLNNPVKNGHVFTGWNGTGIENGKMTVTISKGSTGNRTYTATFRQKGFNPDDDTKPEFAYHAPILSGQIGIKFYVYIPEQYRNPSTCYVDFDVNGDKSANPNPCPFDASETITIDGDTFYTFECFINSVQMADTIHAVMHYGDGRH